MFSKNGNFNGKNYEVQSFLNFCVENKEPDDNIDNYHEYCLLSQEFQIKFIDAFLSFVN